MPKANHGQCLARLETWKNSIQCLPLSEAIGAAGIFYNSDPTIMARFLNDTNTRKRDRVTVQQCILFKRCTASYLNTFGRISERAAYTISVRDRHEEMPVCESRRISKLFFPVLLYRHGASQIREKQGDYRDVFSISTRGGSLFKTYASEGAYLRKSIFGKGAYSI